MKKTRNGYSLLPTEPVRDQAVQGKLLSEFPRDVLILIAIALRHEGTDLDVRYFTMACRAFYALREQLMFHQILAPLCFRSLNANPLGRGNYARVNSLLHAIGVFPNGNFLGADNTQLCIWSPNALELLHRIKPRRSHRILHAAILPDNSIAIISHTMAGCCTREKYRFDWYDPVNYRRAWDLAAVLKYPHGAEQLNKQYALAIDINHLPIKIHWRRVKELRRVEDALSWPECVKIWIEYPHDGIQKIFEINSEDETTSISCPNVIKDCAAWPVARFPVRTYVQLADSRMLGYHAVEDNTPGRNNNRRNMRSNCLILWNSPDYLNAQYRQKSKEQLSANNNNIRDASLK